MASIPTESPTRTMASIDPTNDYVPDDELQDTTWATRNPLKDVQPAQEREKRTSDKNLSASALGTKLDAQRKRKADKNSYLADLEEINCIYYTKLQELARKYAKKFSAVKKQAQNASKYKVHRQPNLQNALIHHKSVEANMGRRDKYSLKEIQKLVAEDPELQDLTKERQEELIDELRQHRLLKTEGSRSSNRAATTDYMHMNRRMAQEVNNHHSRTGAETICFVVPGHLDDAAQPEVISTPGIRGFFPESFLWDPLDIARLAYNFTIGQRDGIAENLIEIRRQCANKVSIGLKMITKKNNIAMNYDNYERSIVVRYHVRLVGWPGAFKSPSTIMQVKEARDLRAALKSGACRWIKMSPADVKLHNEEMEEREEMGEVIGKKRKVRCDKGTTRGDGEDGSEGDEDEDEDEGEDASPPPPPKKQKTTKKLSAKAKASAKENAPAKEIAPAKAKGAGKGRGKGKKGTSSQLPPMAPRSQEFPVDSDDERDAAAADAEVAAAAAADAEAAVAQVVTPPDFNWEEFASTVDWGVFQAQLDGEAAVGSGGFTLPAMPSSFA